MTSISNTENNYTGQPAPGESVNSVSYQQSPGESVADASARFGDRRYNNDGPNGEHLGLGDITLDKPDENANSTKGESTYRMVAMLLFEYAKTIMDRRADRLEQMEAVGYKLTDLSHQEAEKYIEQVKKAEEKQKTGILGKIFAILGLILAVVVAAFTIAAAPLTGGASLAALPALLPSIAAVVGVVVAGFAAGDALFNEGKLMAKIMEETIGKLVEALIKSLKDLGLDDKAAQGIAMAIVGVAMVAIAIVVCKSMSMLGNAMTKALPTATAANNTDDIAKITNAATTAIKADAASDVAEAGKISTTAGTIDDVDDVVNTAATLKKTDATADASKINTTTQTTDNAEDAAQTGNKVEVAAQDTSKPGQVSVHAKDTADDITMAHGVETNTDRINRLNNYAARGMMAELAVDTGTVIHKSSIDIINARLDQLIAEDKGDISKLKAIMKILQQLLGIYEIDNQDAAKMYDILIKNITRFVTEQLPVIDKPLAVRQQV